MNSKLIAFPAERTRRHNERRRDVELSADPYYCFLKQVLNDAARNGLLLPKSLEACSQQIYEKYRNKNDVIARMLHQKGENTP